MNRNCHESLDIEEIYSMLLLEKGGAYFRLLPVMVMPEAPLLIIRLGSFVRSSWDKRKPSKYLSFVLQVRHSSP